MAEYVATKGNDSIGGLLLDNGTLVLASKVNGLDVREIIEDLEEVRNLIDTAIPVLGQIYRSLLDFFSSLINPFPTIIIHNKITYRFTMQPAPWKAIDAVFYSDSEGNRIFEHFDMRMPRAKRELRKELKDYGYIK